MPGVLDLMGYVQKQGEMGRQRGQENRLSQLSSQAYSATPEQRTPLLADMARTSPEAAATQQKQFRQLDTDAAADLSRKAGQFVALAEMGDEATIAAAYPVLAQEAQRVLGHPLPPTYDRKYLAGIQKLAGASGQGGNVQSTYIDAQGNRVAIMRDGSTQVLGQNAPNNQIIDTGNGFYGVNKGNLSAAPVQVGVPSQMGAPQPQQQRAPGEVPFSIDPSLPPQVQAAIRANESQFANAPDGSNLQIPTQGQPQMGGQPGGVLTKAPSTSDAIALQNYTAKQTRRLSPEEVAAAGYRPGTIVQVDGYGNERVAQTPAADRAASSEADRKTVNAAKAKVPQLQNAIRGMGRIDKALAALDGGMFNTGPLDQYAVRNLPAGQELEAAVGGIQNSFLALTRVPGIGSQSDLEARVAAMQYPSLDKAPEVNKRTMENLKLFARDLAQAYEGIVSGTATAAPAAQGGGAVAVSSQAQYDALPSGAIYLEDGKQYRKP